MGAVEAIKNADKRKGVSIDEWHSCLRKRQLNQSDARGLSRRLNRERTSNQFIFNEYLCLYCDHYHVGRLATPTKHRKRRIESMAREALALAIELFLAE